MQMLDPHLPELSVPKVLFRDDENYAYLMTHAPKEAEDWRSILLSGKIKPALGDWSGTLLGKIHFVTYHNPGLIETFRDKTVFDQLRIDPFYRRICERVPQIASSVQPLIEQLQSETRALCHGDFSPKNLLLHSEGFMLVDYETAHCGDFTFDLGFFLSHLFLKAIYYPKRYLDFAFLLASFWRSYQNAFWFKPFEMMLGNAIGHLGACLLARMDGTSPAPYLTSDGQKNAVRRIAFELLRNHILIWDQVMELLQRECQQLEGTNP
jgi:5-methylthioribose kinase